MTSNHGQIGEFNSEVEDRCSYTERLQNYFIANDIKSEVKQRAMCAALALTNSLSPKEPKDASFTDIVKQMTYHYQP